MSFHNVFPTTSLLFRRNIINQAVCYFCGANEETCTHLFLRCPIAKAIIFELLNINTDSIPFASGKDFNVYCIYLHHQFKEDGLLLILKLLVIVEGTWNQKNSIRLGITADLDIHTFINSLVCFDGSFNSDLDRGGWGFIIFDNSGCVKFSNHGHLAQCQNAEVAELESFHQALQAVSRGKLTNVVFISDCLNVVNFIKKKC